MIAASVLGSGIAAIDSTVVGIALPAIGRGFHTGVAPLQWVVTGYMLTLASLLLVGGSLSDRFGRRRLFQIGVVWFALASAGCGLAPNAGFLIGMRVLQGIGGALLTPGSLAILQASFVPEDRGRAIRSLVGARRRGDRDRPAPRWLPDLRRLVAVDLLRQRARRWGRPLADGPSRARVE